jgi:ABC-2 type transport system ATP-binding protein
LEIARGLLHHPKIIFLDEPTIGLDPQTRNSMWNYLKELNKNEGITIFFTTHYMDEAEALSDELAIIDRGHVLAQGTPPEVCAKYLSSRMRIDVAAGFTDDELKSYGKTIKVGNLSRLFVDEKMAEEVSREALKRKATLSIAPVTLDDVFVEIVGSGIDEEQENQEQAHTRGAYER